MVDNSSSTHPDSDDRAKRNLPKIKRIAQSLLDEKLNAPKYSPDNHRGTMLSWQTPEHRIEVDVAPHEARCNGTTRGNRTH